MWAKACESASSDDGHPQVRALEDSRDARHCLLQIQVATVPGLSLYLLTALALKHFLEVFLPEPPVLALHSGLLADDDQVLRIQIQIVLSHEHRFHSASAMQVHSSQHLFSIFSQLQASSLARLNG